MNDSKIVVPDFVNVAMNTLRDTYLNAVQLYAMMNNGGLDWEGIEQLIHALGEISPESITWIIGDGENVDKVFDRLEAAIATIKD